MNQHVDFLYLQDLRRQWNHDNHINVPDIECSCGFLGEYEYTYKREFCEAHDIDPRINKSPDEDQ